MTDKELRKLSRGELLEMLLAQSKDMQSLQQQLDAAAEKLESRDLDIAKAGSIAEASLELNGVFAAAQAAADQYLENVSRMTGRQEEICAALEAETKTKAAAMMAQAENDSAAMKAEAEKALAAAKTQSEIMLKETEQQCMGMKAVAKRETEQYWNDVSSRLENFYAEHAGLRELLAQITPKEADHE